MRSGYLFDPPEGEVYAEVAVPVPAAGLFSYAIPEAARDLVLPGSRVEVPFSGRQLTGVVVATRGRLPDGVDAGKVRPLGDCIDPLPLLSPVLLELTRWIAERTMSSWGEAVRAALPAGIETVGRRRAALTEEGRAAAGNGAAAGLGGGAGRLLETLAEGRGGAATFGALARRCGRTAICARLYGLARRGLVTIDDEWAAGIGGRWREVVRPARHSDLASARQRTERAPVQRRAIERLWAEAGGIAVQELCAAAGCSVATIKALAGKGLVELRREAVAADPSMRWSGGDDGAGSFELTASQAAALGRIEDGAGGFASYLLHGVTGSGKTEVYLRAARSVLQRGRSAILLVPEIGLTPLLAHRAGAVLGDAVGVMHSGMSAGERLATWWRARSGDLRAVIGPRSALFAPLPDVGLIVVDEEQDGAYKQDEAPRYHGRDAALRRGLLEGAAVVLGSATPAVETFHAAARGSHEVLRIADRVAGRPLPAVELVDMRAEWERSGRSLLSERLEGAVADCLGRGEQALLLLNRRGFAAAVRCRSCGERVGCPHCSVSLTYHRPRRALRCHYCDFQQPLPSACPTCGSPHLHEMGHGTQQLQQALAALFPSARIRRFDADETRRKGAHADILSAFGRGDLDLLVGTQMLAKGHDFPGVTLVGAVGADDALGLPDFRAAERTFQLLTQMAGRAGRGDAAGTVVLQAYACDHYAIGAAVKHDYEAFYAHEIAFRRRLGYPPFTALIGCVCRGRSVVVVKEEADILAGALRRSAPEEVHLLGPASPPLAKLRGLHRIQLLLRGPDRIALRAALAAAIGDCRRRGKAPRDLRIDVDPLSLM